MDFLSTGESAVSEADNTVVFLHKIVPGGADRSYGIHVAQLAGLPAPVIQRANEIMAELEKSSGRAMQLKDASILLPDIGGTLYYSELHVYDLIGLTDRVIARNIDVDQNNFYNYIFDTVKPTFIHTHGWWAYRANLERDLRFAVIMFQFMRILTMWS